MIELSEIKKDLTWVQAIDWAKSMENGWELPTREELLLIQFAHKLCYPNLQDMQGVLWSSSINIHNTYSVWVVDFNHGFVNCDDKSRKYFARCVRGPFEDLALWVFGERGLSSKSTKIISNDNSVYCSCNGPSMICDTGLSKYLICSICKKEKKQ